MAEVSRRVEILEAALVLAETQGMAGLSANRVAKRLGWNPSLVFYYFKTQDDLFAECLALVVERNRMAVLSLCKPEASAREMMEAYLRGNLHWALAYPAQVELLLGALAQRRSFINLGDRVSQALQTGKSRIRDLLTRLVSEEPGQPGQGLELERSVEIIHNQLTGQIISSIHSHESSNTKRKKLLEFHFSQSLHVFEMLYPIPGKIP